MSAHEVEVSRGVLNIFPLERRAAQVARVADRLHRASSDKVADRYSGFVALKLFAELEVLGVDEIAQDEAVGAFFFEVEQARFDLQAAEPVPAEIINLR